MASQERDSRRKGKFIYSIFWCFPPPSPSVFARRFLAFSFCTWSLWFTHQALLTPNIPASPHPLPFSSELTGFETCWGGAQALHLYHTLFCFFFFFKQGTKNPCFHCQGDNLATYPLHTASFTLVLARDLHLNLSFHLNHEIHTFLTSPMQFIQTYTVSFNMYK